MLIVVGLPKSVSHEFLLISGLWYVLCSDGIQRQELFDEIAVLVLGESRGVAVAVSLDSPC